LVNLTDFVTDTAGGNESGDRLLARIRSVAIFVTVSNSKARPRKAEVPTEVIT
jgi:hypothetical protein